MRQRPWFKITTHAFFGSQVIREAIRNDMYLGRSGAIVPRYIHQSVWWSYAIQEALDLYQAFYKSK
jgi:hypothetical protein